MSYSPQTALDKTSNAAERKEAFDELKADFAKLREDLGMLRRDAANVGVAGAAEAKARLKDGASAASDKAAELTDYVSTEFFEIQRQAKSAVRKNPLSAVAAALAVGYFLSSISRR